MRPFVRPKRHITLKKIGLHMNYQCSRCLRVKVSASQFDGIGCGAWTAKDAYARGVQNRGLEILRTEVKKYPEAISKAEMEQHLVGYTGDFAQGPGRGRRQGCCGTCFGATMMAGH